MQGKTTIKEMRRIEARAKRLVQFCFRDTSLENLHSAGKITQAEMRALMIEAVNNVFTFLLLPEAAVAALPEPEDWADAQLNEGMVKFAALLQKRSA